MFISGKTQIKILIYLGVAIFSITGPVSAPVFAQDDAFVEDEDFFEDDGFTDDIDLNEFDLEGQFEQDLLEEPLDEPTQDAFDPDPEPEEQYIDEDVLSEGTREALESALLQRRDFLAAERVNFVPNILYGVGTGLIIGGWFALLTANTSRDTLRSIGLGIVLGGVMGSVIGGRSVITPNAPRPEQILPTAPPPQGKLLNPKADGLTVSFQWNF